MDEPANGMWNFLERGAPGSTIKLHWFDETDEMLQAIEKPPRDED
jgi:hypothetical protein